ncbi:uncharacterized protein LOC110112570 [Dendrobium catenatum]|uniref:Uncharacterized protein n=1 Tax=Dendrobium catenatum TaxID=906689 RepID=A0A2I0WZR4_9ASPA|nr:uncharacterized protein LOC110112570 [Dendrobium catenatum]PKU81150.1 hypothetical protein MA16_Dca014033 [Dendrobium catenatum]
MSNFPFSPSASTAALLLLFFLSISMPTPISSNNLTTRRNLHSFNSKEDLDDSPIPKSISPTKKKPVLDFPEPKNKTKSFKPKATNSTSSSSSKISIILSVDTTTPTKSKLNKTVTISPAVTKNKPNKISIAGELSAISISKFKLNKTSSAAKKNVTKSNLNKIALLKSNSTKTQQFKSLNPTPKIQKKLDAKDPPPSKPQSNTKLKPLASPENWLDDADSTGAGEDGDDLISDFRDLPSRLHSTLFPDLEKLSTTSKLYLSKTHREIAAGVKPFVGNKYAPSIASATSSALLLLPLLLVTALFRHLLRTGSSASLHRALLFVQAYLAIYFATLSLTAVMTGLEPLRFFYAASPAAYAWTQAVQTFGYVVYLVAQLIALVVAFSAGEEEHKTGKMVGLAQMLLGLSVGMHYYITVFHRAVTGEAPRANWKVHGIYAACFIVICGLGRAERRKKAYLHGVGGDDSKKS